MTGITRVTRHLLASVIVGALVAILMVVIDKSLLAASVGWDAAALTFLVTTWLHLWPMDEARTRITVDTEAPSVFITESMVVLAAVLSLGTVVLLLFNNSAQELPPVLRSVVGLATIGLAWLVVHTVFALRYARQYYATPMGGIDFHMTDLPCYADFAYVSFGVGMSFEIADTDISTTALRRTVVKHALLSYLFATIILAVTLNLIASINF
jgi:uncharacterized membrane protein